MQPDTHIQVQGVSKTFHNLPAVQDVSFSIEKGRLVGLLGPSGGGKTTLLRMLAGLEQPNAGDISFHGTRVNDLPPQARGIGFVFQNYALFKHMTVAENIAFGLRVQKQSKSQIEKRVRYLLDLTGLTGLGDRLPHQLSGGQRQRVAFARALAPEPQLLLLDEPFAAIDAKVRKELRTWLREMISRVGITTIFVTHDQEEAVEVADEIMIMSHGRLEQKGTPWEIYKSPGTPFVASFIGESNETADLTPFPGFAEAALRLFPTADAASLKAIIRPENIEVTLPHESLHPDAAELGIVRDVQFRGRAWHLEIEVGASRLIAQRSLEQEPLRVGDAVHVLIHRLYLFTETGSEIVENPNKPQRNGEISYEEEHRPADDHDFTAQSIHADRLRSPIKLQLNES